VPYIVLIELDKLKFREEKIAKLARAAISYINDCFKEKDKFMIGQNAIDNKSRIINIDTDDDLIINCALQTKKITKKLILLSNDKNLRNKSIVNGFESFSSDMLSFIGSNEENDIKFED
jgi:predicted ribonuclease YlaK